MNFFKCVFQLIKMSVIEFILNFFSMYLRSPLENGSDEENQSDNNEYESEEEIVEMNGIEVIEELTDDDEYFSSEESDVDQQSDNEVEIITASM